MQPRLLATVVIVGVAAVVVVGVLQSAQVACAAWHISNFFNVAPDVPDVIRCVEAGADLEARTGESGSTPLHHAAVSGNAEVVAVLLEAGADSMLGGGDDTPLHWATTPEVVAVLLEAGADLDAPDDNGKTPLHWAALLGTAEVVTALLEAGADPKARDSKDKLPFDYAEDNARLRATDAYWKLNDDRLQ